MQRPWTARHGGPIKRVEDRGTARHRHIRRPLRNFIAPIQLAEQHLIVAKIDELMETRRRLLEALLAEALEPEDERELEAAD
jgi:hypothetical protein